MDFWTLEEKRDSRSWTYAPIDGIFPSALISNAHSWRRRCGRLWRCLVDAIGLHGHGSPVLAIIANLVFLPPRCLWASAVSIIWFCLTLIPPAGVLILLIWFARPGTRGTNRFGPNPLAA
jgi:hypothetical protein